MSDLIDREYAIKRFCEDGTYLERHGVGIMTLCEAKQRAVDLIESFPSVQSEVLACGSGELVQESDSLVQDLVKDCISRQAAIVVFENSGLDDDSKDTVVRVLEQLPSAQPQRKKGRWIFHETENDRYDDMICPFCKMTYTVDAYRIDDIGFTAEDFDYCPNCGADMRGGNNE